MGNSGMSFGSVAASMGQISKRAEKSLGELMDQMSKQEEPSTADLLQFQTAMKRWSLSHELEGTIIKELGDTLKGIVQKAP